MNISEVKKGFKMGFPVVIGYAPVAAAFGLICKSGGFSLFETFAFSFFVYAGASQFMGVNLIMLGVGPVSIILTTFLVNLRHFLMSSAVSKKIDENCKKFIPVIAYGMTDETFSIVSLTEGKIKAEYILTIEFITHMSWYGFGVLGYIFGEFLPKDLSMSMGIALYALFIAMIVPQMKKSKYVACIVILSGIINALAKMITFLPKGWSIIIAIIVTSFAGSFLLSRRRGEIQMNFSKIFYIIAGMTAVTYLPRLLPFYIFSKINLSKRMMLFLKCIPYSALGALIFQIHLDLCRKSTLHYLEQLQQ